MSGTPSLPDAGVPGAEVHGGAEPGRGWPSVLVPAVATAAAAWSLIPFALWWSGADIRYFESAWDEWLLGTSVAALIAVVLLLALRHRLAAGIDAAWDRVLAVPHSTFIAWSAGILAVLAVLMCLAVFAGNPRNVDGFAQLFQARILLAGRLWVPPPAELANFATLQMILGPDRWYAQYPPGQALVLAAGLVIGAWWALNPLLAVLLVLFTVRVARWCGDESSARLAPLLMCVSPFVVAMAGSEMSHLAAATLGMGAAAAAAATGAGGRRPALAAGLAGAALGGMVAFRPLDAVAAAAPVALIVFLAAPRRVRAFAIVAAGGVLATIPTLWFNAHTTGRWLEFGYTALWGPQHSLGFHPVPWGVPLTPLRAVALTGLDLHQLNTYLFDLPLPILAVIAVGLAAGRRSLGPRDAVPVLGAVALSGLLFFYFHRDVFYGPRFLFSAAPWVVVLVSRALVLMRRANREMLPGLSWGVAGVTFMISAFAVGFVKLTPTRLATYRDATPALHPDRDAERAGIGHAVVVIPDGWGTRLIARSWALGVPVRRSTRFYGGIDACTLELALDAAERAGTGGEALDATLDALLALRRPGVRGPYTDDPNLRLQPGDSLAAPCRAEIETDRRGFLQFAPFLYLNAAGLDGDIVWARDLGPRNAALFARYDGRRFFRYARPAPDAAPVFTPLLPNAARGAER